MNGPEASINKAQVDSFNKSLGKQVDQTLDKDDFLKILISQLTNQDPTQPMEDKEFIAQMAQFSTLEQMTNISQGFSKLSSVMNSAQAMNLIGKTVDVQDGDGIISGQVSAVTTGDYPQIRIGSKYYDFSNITTVMNEESSL